MPHTHDGPVHLARMAAYYKALGDGQILPRWAGELNYGYGMPLFNFYYHLPYLLSSFCIRLGLNLVNSFKINLLVSFILSGIGMFLFSQKLFKDKSKAILATVLYQFAPFHLVDIVVRGDIGEAMVFSFLPFVLLSILYGFEEKNTKKTIIITGFTTALLLLSHTAIALLFFAICCLFILFFGPTKVKKLQAFYGLGIGLLLTAFYWIPILAERKYTYGDVFMKDMYKTHFVPFWHFFIPNLTNSPKFQTGGVDISFGLVQTISLLLALISFKKTKILYFIFVLLFGSLFFMQPVSVFLWKNFSILRAYQFPWRFLTITVFALSLVTPAIWMTKKLNAFAVWGIMIVTILCSMVYWTPPLGFDRVDENYYWHYPMNTTYFGETDLIWSAGQTGSFPKLPYEIIEGKGTILWGERTGILHKFSLVSDNPTRIVDHTQYYPGWRVYVDGGKIPVEFQDQNYRGQITFRLPKGNHDIIVAFGQSPLRALAEIISVSTIVILGFFVLI
jgi:uncharacterized membrane protein